MTEKIYLNGNIISRDEAVISPFDFGYLYGYGLYETTRVYQGKPFYLKEHIKRLETAASRLRLKPDIKEIEDGALAVGQQNNYPNARLRIVVSYGEGDLKNLTVSPKPTVLITASPYKPPVNEVYKKGFKVIYSSLRRQNDSWLSEVKSISFLEKLLAKREAQQGGADDALLLNDKGFLAEASTSNLFIVENGKIYTPPLSAGLLPGITRRLVLELAQEKGLLSGEEDITPQRLEEAEEAFITNSMIEVMPLTLVAEKRIGSGYRGRLTERIAQAYKDLVIKAVSGINSNL